MCISETSILRKQKNGYHIIPYHIVNYLPIKFTFNQRKEESHRVPLNKDLLIMLLFDKFVDKCLPDKFVVTTVS